MRRPGLVLGAGLLSVLLAPLILKVARSWPTRVAVSGHSMEPTLRDGDWLLVDPAAGPLRTADLVVVRDPRDPDRLLVKRVIAMAPDGSVSIAGDHPAHREESSSIGRIGLQLVVGRPWLRYWPVSRVARL